MHKYHVLLVMLCWRRLVHPMFLILLFILTLLLYQTIRSDYRVYQVPRADDIQYQHSQIRFLNERHSFNMSVPFSPGLCDGKALLIGVPSSPDHFEERAAIRGTWAANLPDTVLLRFFIGGTDPAIVVQLEEEQREFGDVVFYDLPDEYDNLYLKINVIFQWQQEFCAQAQFLLKTDDDTTIHVPRLLHHIEQRFKPAMNGTKAVFGFLFTSAPVERRGKWGIPRSVFAPDIYPPYCNGPSYLVSKDAVGAILTQARFENAFKFEDVLYTGILAEKTGVQKVAQGDVFYRGENLDNATKCDEQGVPLVSAVYVHKDNSATLQSETFALMKNIKCAH